MKRMKKYSYILLALPLLLGSCEAYLDVNPKSEVTDKELFSTAEGCEDAIYGIYTEMGTNKNLFAYALTFAYPELMTGNFTISQSDNLAYVGQRNPVQPECLQAVAVGMESLRPSSSAHKR